MRIFVLFSLLLVVSVALINSCGTNEHTETSTTAPATTTPSPTAPSTTTLTTTTLPATTSPATTLPTTTPPPTTAQALNFTGEWSGILEGGWTETYEYPEDILGGGINTLVFSYQITLTIDVEDDGSFVGEASVELQQPQWTAQYTTVYDDSHYTELTDYGINISPTEFTVPVFGFISPQGEMDLNLSDVPERNQVYNYVTEDDFGNVDSWETGFAFPAITDYYHLQYASVDGDVISLSYLLEKENPEATVPSSTREEAAGTLSREG